MGVYMSVIWAIKGAFYGRNRERLLCGYIRNYCRAMRSRRKGPRKLKGVNRWTVRYIRNMYVPLHGPIVQKDGQTYPYRYANGPITVGKRGTHGRRGSRRSTGTRDEGVLPECKSSLHNACYRN